MATMRLVPSAYSRSSSSYVTVTNESNMYTNTDNSSNYATLRGRNRNSSTAYYCFIHGFNFGSIPSNATVSSFTIKIKCYRSSNQRTGTNYYLRLASSPSNSSVISSTTTSTNIETSVSTITIPTGNLTWATMSGYGSNFSIEVPLSSNSSSYPYIYVYGAEIEVTYTAEDVHVTGVSLDKATDTVEMGETTTLTATVAPSNATDKSITWSTSDSSVATVSNGIVTGVSQGTARITVTTHDGGYTDYCDVTVTPMITYTYAQTNALVPGKNYLIANGNSGSVYLMTNESGGSRQLEGVSVTVTNGKITINGSVKAKAEFSCSLYDSNNDITTCIISNGQYLYSDSASGLRFETTSSLNRFWHYADMKFWQFKSTTSDGYSDTSSEYKYYLTVSNGNFTDDHVTSPSIEDTDLPAIYLFTEDTGETGAIYCRTNGAWIEATAVYKKVNGSWVQQTDISNVFQSGVNYKRGS